MNVTAKHRNLQMAAQKVRLVLPLVKGKTAEEAVQILALTNKAAALPVSKAIRSAMANAEHNNSIDPKRLQVSVLTADEGPSLKRFKPVARGRAHGMQRRTTHLTVILSDTGRTSEQVTDTRRNKAAKSVVSAASKTRSAAKKLAAKDKADVTKAPAKAATPKAAPKRTGKKSEIKDQNPPTGVIKETTQRRTGSNTGRGGAKGKES
jgi:large subunit ribosomal protein L22